MSLQVVDVERIPLRVPFRKEVKSVYEVDLAPLQAVEVIRVTLSDGSIGYGESLPLLYPDRVVEASHIAKTISHHPLEAIGHRIGSGLRMALVDAAGKALDLPAHTLFGLSQIRDSCRVAWWSGQLATKEILVAEVARARAARYSCHKIKARPWLDVSAAIMAMAAEAGTDYTVTPDWNRTLLTAGDALDILTEVDEIGCVGFNESPIRSNDVAGLRHLSQKAKRPIIDHFTPELFHAWIQVRAVDGFVATGQLPDLIHQGRLADEFNLSCFLQVTGLGLTTAFLLHVASVLKSARWPIVSAANIYDHDLLSHGIEVMTGEAMVPSGPGLGVEVNEAALAEFSSEMSDEQMNPARKLLLVQFLNGRTRAYAGIKQLRRDCTEVGSLPVQSAGVHLEIVSDDGSAAFEQRYSKALCGQHR